MLKGSLTSSLVKLFFIADPWLPRTQKGYAVIYCMAPITIFTKKFFDLCFMLLSVSRLFLVN